MPGPAPPTPTALQLGPVDGLVSTFGPFVLPVILFAVGVVGYLVLVRLGHAGAGEEPDQRRR